MRLIESIKKLFQTKAVEEPKEAKKTKSVSKRGKDVHVSKKNGQWEVRQNKETKSTHKTQAEAIKSAKKLAKSLEVDLAIHGTDGKIRKKMSYGNDPRNVKG